MKSLLARLATEVLRWHVLTGSGPAAVLLGTFFTAVVVLDPYEVETDALHMSFEIHPPYVTEIFKEQRARNGEDTVLVQLH